MSTMEHCPECGTRLEPDSSFCPECGQRIVGPPSSAKPSGEPEGLATIGSLETIEGDTTRRSSARDALPALEPGTVFAERYTILERVGAGGMGVVYRATDAVTEREVALKLIRPDRLANEADLERLIREGLTARDVRHRNVVAVYDVGRALGPEGVEQPFLSMEFIEGRSLRTWERTLRERGEDVPFAVAARIIEEVLGGLEAAHEQGVVHRDLKPENIMLLADPSEGEVRLKIVDFGIACAARGSGRAADSGTGSAVGTPHYMAPEQVTQADLAGPTADLYALSVIFYELLVGVLPQGHWQPPSGGRADVPRAVDDLVQEGLANRPASRPESARIYRERLQAAREGGAGDEITRRLKEGLEWAKESRMNPQKRKRWRIAFIGLLILAVIGSLIDAGGSGVEAGSSELLTGYWSDTFGNVFDIYVDEGGYFSGGAPLPDGSVLQIEGRVQDRAIEFDLSAYGRPGLAHGQGTWDGSRSIEYTAVTVDGEKTRGRFAIRPAANDL